MNEITIPKKIHYCWFGGKPLPRSARKCITSWKKYFPDYEVIEWNEQNYDVNQIPYISQAYQAKKYAFVSDYARFDILYQHGGVYFDTDVEVIKSFHDILEKGAFFGCEIDGNPNHGADKHIIEVAPGLGMAAEAGQTLYRAILDYYSTQQFFDGQGRMNAETVVRRVTQLLLQQGLKDEKGFQQVKGINIYPKEYFNPLDNNTGKLTLTKNTYSIHWYTMSWMNLPQKLRSRITRPIHRIFGDDCFARIKSIGRKNERISH